MRGAFTAGVLDFFLSDDIHFDAVYGVSAGASNGASYISRQAGRNRKVFVDGTRAYKYFSPRNLFTQRSLLDIDLLFNRYPNDLIPFDYDTFESSPSRFYTCLTDCETGEPAYIERNEVGREEFMMKVLAGSNSLPLVSPIVRINGRGYLDGGLSDSIPLKKAVSDGCGRSVVILTRPEGYRKKKSSASILVNAAYRRYPKLTAAFGRRHLEYNASLDYCLECEKNGRALVIRPGTTFGAGRTESDSGKLENLYRLGFDTAGAQSARIKAFIRE